MPPFGTSIQYNLVAQAISQIPQTLTDYSRGKWALSADYVLLDNMSLSTAMAQHRCLCTSHKCKERRTPDGEPGVFLNSRQFRNHQERDQRCIDKASVLEAQARAIRVQEEAIITAMSSLSVTAPRSSTLPQTDKYRVEHVRRLVSSISELKDEVSTLREEVWVIGPPLADVPHPDETVQENLLKFDSSRRRVNEMLQRLAQTKRGEYRKDDSVREIREQTTEALQELLQFIKRQEYPWKEILVHRQAEREAFLASGGVEYDCCE